MSENNFSPENNYVPDSNNVPENNCVPENNLPPVNNYVPENNLPPENNYVPNGGVKKSKKLLLILIPVIAVAAALIMIFTVVMPTMKKAAYNTAMNLMETEQYQEAREAFEKLGNYEDSEDKAFECANLEVKLNNYNAAKQKFDKKDWEGAKTAFQSLKGFKDSDKLAGECQKHIDYEEAVSCLTDDAEMEELESALETFTSLGDFEDAKAKAAECQTRIDTESKYLGAVQDLNDKFYTSAKAAFDELGNYKDSAERSNLCSLMIDYAAAFDLYDADEYEQAIEAFNALESNYEDADSRITNCGERSLDDMRESCNTGIAFEKGKAEFESGDYDAAEATLSAIDNFYLKGDCVVEKSDMLSYIEAMRYYNAGKFYDAYLAFNSCGAFRDAADMAGKCAQPFPSNGVVYANPSYSNRSSQLTINNAGYMNAYYKLYFGDTLVMTVFIRENEKATFSLPAGTYRMNKAYGETWYGPEDMFGDDGYYWNCSFGNSDTALIESGYGYEISTGGEGTGISTDRADRGSI